MLDGMTHADPTSQAGVHSQPDAGSGDGWSTVTVAGPAGPIEVRSVGDGPAVLMVPSLGRGAADFLHLGRSLSAGGYRAIVHEPRGIGGSTGSLEGVSMGDLAGDTAVVIEALGVGPATLVGHAFGNRVARLVAALHPGQVESVVLLACGGRVPAAPEHRAALRRVFDVDSSPEEHLAAVGAAFFAPCNDASVWAGGWHPVVAHHQGRAVADDDIEVWWTAGSADVLVLQPADDVVALPANARSIVDLLGDRASLVVVADAGHALLPEQPQVVADTLLEWLRGRSRRVPR